MPRVYLPWPVTDPVMLLVCVAFGASSRTLFGNPLAAPIRDADSPIRLPRAKPKPMDTAGEGLDHAVRMIRRAENAASIGQIDFALPWLREAIVAATRVVEGAATPDQRAQAVGLIFVARDALRRIDFQHTTAGRERAPLPKRLPTLPFESP